LGAVLADLGLPEDLLVDDYERLLENPDVDAVFICNPNVHHGPQSIAAMEAGKHVFCEKPCSITFGDFCRQIDLEQSHPRLITFVDYILHFDPMETRFRQMVAEGLFGTVTQLQVNYRHEINIAGDKAWKLHRRIVGDSIGMGIAHALMCIVEAMSSQAKPVEVYATSSGMGSRGFETEPVWNIQIRFDNGAAGFCFGNVDRSNGYDAYHSLYGTEGAFLFDSLLDRPQQVRYWSAKQADGRWVYPLDRTRCRGEGLEEFAWSEDMATPTSGDVIHHQTDSCVDHFIQCVKSGTPSPLSFAGSASIAEIGWGAIISAGRGLPVSLPLDRDDAASFFAG